MKPALAALLLVACGPTRQAPTVIDAGAPVSAALARLAASLPPDTVATAYFFQVPLELVPEQKDAERALIRLAAASGGRLRWDTARVPSPGLPTVHVTALIEHQLVAKDMTFVVEVRGERWSLPAGVRLTEDELVVALGTTLGRVAHGRRKVGITTGFGEPSARALTAALADGYDVALIDWAAHPEAIEGVDALIVDGPSAPVAESAQRALDAHVMTGKPVLLLVGGVSFAVEGGVLTGRAAAHGLGGLLAAYGFAVAPQLIVDKHQVVPAPIGDFPLAQVLARAPGEILAHASYVPVPFSSPVTVLGTRAATPLLRSSPTSFEVDPPVSLVADSRMPTREPMRASPGLVAVAAEGSFPSGFARGASPPTTRVVIVGGAGLCGDDLQERAMIQVNLAGFRAARQMVDWLLAER